MEYELRISETYPEYGKLLAALQEAKDSGASQEIIDEIETEIVQCEI